MPCWRTNPTRERVDRSYLERLPGRMCGGRDVSIGSCHRSGGMGRTGPRPDGGEPEPPIASSVLVSSPPSHPLYQPPDRNWQVKVQVPRRRVSRVFVWRHPWHHAGKTERRHPSSSVSPIATRVAKVQMWVYPQNEIESHHQELQQSVFELWELSPRTSTLWLFPMAPWPAVASPSASAAVSETMGQW